MNKQELIKEMSSTSGLSISETKRVLDAMISIAIKTLSRGESISLQNIGVFSVVERVAKTGRHPMTGAEIKIAPKRVVKYKANCPGPHLL